MTEELLSFLHYHKELAFLFTKCSGMTSILAEMEFDKLVKSFFNSEKDIDELHKHLAKHNEKLDHSKFSEKSVELLLNIILADKKYNPKYIKSISEFYVNELGQSPESFYKFCLNSGELKDKLLGEPQILVRLREIPDL